MNRFHAVLLNNVLDILRRTLFCHACEPWEDDSTKLHADPVEVMQR